MDERRRRPTWLDRPALSRVSLTDPRMLKWFAQLNGKRPYGDQVKPWNFLLAAHVRPFGHPSNTDPARFQLITPYELDPRKWLQLRWINRYDGREYRITTKGDVGAPGVARVVTYGDILLTYAAHPESKSLGPDGARCAPDTAGLLQRRPVQALGIAYIGKESNRLESVEAGMEHDWGDVRSVYENPDDRATWDAIRSLLKAIPARELAQATGLSERQIKRIRNGHSVPPLAIRQLLARLVNRA